MQDVFSGLSRGDDEWSGQEKIECLAGWGQALDETDPPDARPAERPDRSPTGSQREAYQLLATHARAKGGPVAGWAVKVLVPIVTKLVLWFIHRPSKTSSDDVSETRLREGIVPIEIVVGDRDAPSDSQRKAWADVLARGDATWEELLDRAFEIYRRQLPARRKWWRAIYGDYLLDRRLPEVADRDSFRRLIRVEHLRIREPDQSTGIADVEVLARATWDVDCVAALIRDGRVETVGQLMDVVHPTDVASRPRIDDPTFGRLERIADDDAMEYVMDWKPSDGSGRSGFEGVEPVRTRPWLGRTRFDAMVGFANVADQKASYHRDRKRADRPASRLRWDLLDGEFELRVYAPAGQPPSEAQAAAWRAFERVQASVGRALIDAVFERYQGGV